MHQSYTTSTIYATALCILVTLLCRPAYVCVITSTAHLVMFMDCIPLESVPSGPYLPMHHSASLHPQTSSPRLPDPINNVKCIIQQPPQTSPKCTLLSFEVISVLYCHQKHHSTLVENFYFIPALSHNWYTCGESVSLMISASTHVMTPISLILAN